MKKLTKEEIANEPWRGRGGSSKVFRTLIAMKPGDIILIEPQDWGTRKYPPTDIVRYIKKKYKYNFIVLRHAAGMGWAVERVS